MNVLVLASNLPCPPTDGWRIRVYQLLKGLCGEHRVSLLSFSDGRPNPEVLEQLRRLCDSVEVVERNPRYSPFDLAMGLVGSTPFNILNYRSLAMQRKVDEVISRRPYDVVQVEDIHMAQYVLSLLNILKVLDMHNIESKLMRSYAAIQPEPFRRLYARITSEKLRHYEREHSAAFDRVLTCSELDQNFVAEALRHPRVSVIPNGVDTVQFSPRPKGEEARTMVFVGRMDYTANGDAVIYFCREVLPLIWRTIPDARFYAVGQGASHSAAKLGPDPRVVFTGFVDDVREFLSKTAVFVVPIRFGGGTRIKILEAMAMGKAVVSTTAGCEGLKLVPNRDLLLADRPEEFARAVIDLLLSDEHRRRLGEQARQLVVREYSWSMIQKRLRRVYRGLPASSTKFARVEG